MWNNTSSLQVLVIMLFTWLFMSFIIIDYVVTELTELITVQQKHKIQTSASEISITFVSDCFWFVSTMM